MIEIIQNLVTNCGYTIISIDDHEVQLQNSLNEATGENILILHTNNHALNN